MLPTGSCLLFRDVECGYRYIGRVSDRTTLYPYAVDFETDTGEKMNRPEAARKMVEWLSDFIDVATISGAQHGIEWYKRQKQEDVLP